MKKKVLIVLNDGVSFRNFGFQKFAQLGEKRGWDVSYLNQASLDLEVFNVTSFKVNTTPNFWTNLLKKAKTKIELENFERKFDDKIYREYVFSSSWNSVKKSVKNLIVEHYRFKYAGKRLKNLRRDVKQQERKSEAYKSCLKLLKELEPDVVFNLSQRSVLSIAPIIAAQDLKIQTATFIYSWDNLPKATLVVEPDHYFVWSEYMKSELQNYYPYIKQSQIHVTGTPQFEMHKDDALIQTKADFYSKHNLDIGKDYICFSGDDETTSPHDPSYLEDLAKNVLQLNTEGYKLGIIFRRCPVDFSDRYDSILELYKDIIIPLAPIWNANGTMWNTIIPQAEDQALLLNTVRHSKLVVNLGSSMVFDAICHDTPCAYVNYNPNVEVLKKDIYTIYKYVHFRSMPSTKAVIWFNTAEEISEKIKTVLDNRSESLHEARQWFKVINAHPVENASARIWGALKNIT